VINQAVKNAWSGCIGVLGDIGQASIVLVAGDLVANLNRYPA
jgi:hypothetical protein